MSSDVASAEVTTRSALSLALRMGLLRLAALPFSAGASIGTMYLILRQVGPETFGYVSLVFGLPLLVPFADLGLGTALVNLAARRSLSSASDAEFRRTLVGSLVFLGLVAGALAAATGLLAWGGILSPLLGVPDTSEVNAFAAAALSVFLMSVPFSLGARVVLGLGRNDILTGMGPLNSVLALLFTVGMIKFDGPPFAYALGSAVAALACSVVLACVAMRAAGLSIGELRASWDDRVAPSRLMWVALPALWLTVAGALLIQIPRIALSHVGAPIELSRFAVGFQFYLPFWSLIYTAGVSFWPRFARQRDDRRGFWVIWMIITGIGVAGLVGWAALGGFVLGTASHHSLGDLNSLALALGVLGVVQAASLPAQSYLTQGRGLVVSAASTTTAGVIAIATIVGWTEVHSAVGVVLTITVCAALLQVAPTLFVTDRELRRSFAEVEVDG